MVLDGSTSIRHNGRSQTSSDAPIVGKPKFMGDGARLRSLSLDIFDTPSVLNESRLQELINPGHDKPLPSVHNHLCREDPRGNPSVS
jgi:hypothetical protein